MNDRSKVLIIDDEEVVLDSCTQILDGSSYLTETAPDGVTGLKRVEEFQPDLVFIDLKMPGMPGMEVLERINQLDSTIVTVVITGFATVGSAVDAMKKGAYDFLPKPFTPDEFRLITKRGLDKRRLMLETIALRREKEMLREQFAAIVSHELKAPLSAVQQNLFFLTDELSDQLTEEQKNRFERMKIKINDLINLIQTWLRILSVDVNKIKDTFKPTDVHLIISKAIESIQVHANRKDIELVSSIKEPLGSVNGDEGTLVEVLINILGNAIKYSRSGGRVLIEAEKSANEILISVVDNGVGISEEDLPHIFDDFFMGKADRGAEQSSGLGLGIARRIVEVHEGSITVVSELGKGSTFVIRLPLLKEESRTISSMDIDMARP
ncbi:MAG TPA: hybrid sensor histidine kinase/response regulator [Anaerolineales bacterium]|nr:hybrid sensor histidine kinase/response regulator [Anaerolineales bacterium]